jgi:hypothetical protein
MSRIPGLKTGELKTHERRFTVPADVIRCRVTPKSPGEPRGR